MKDTFFSMPRFVNLCRKELVESWRSNLLRIGLMYGVMTVVLLWVGYLEYHNKTSLVRDDSVHSFTPVFFMWSLWAFGCLSASFTMEKMKSKTNRIYTLMTPATPFEKYFSRWLVFTVVFLVLFLISFWLADQTRVLVYTLTYPDLKGIAATPFSYFVGDNTNHYTLCRTADQFGLIIALYFFTQSGFVLGSTIWPKNAFLKTFVAGAIVLIVYVLFIMWMNKLFHVGTRSYIWIGEPVFTTLTLIVSVATLFNWTLAYFRFKESEIINRM